MTSRPFSLKSDTFWTLCSRCRIRYEYQKMYLNQKLLCHHCQQPFTAIEMPALTESIYISRPCPVMFAASKELKSVLTSSTRPTETATMVQSFGQHLKGGRKGNINMERGDKALEKNTAAEEKVDESTAFNVGSPCLEGEKSSIKRQIDSLKCTNKGSLVTEGSKSEHKGMSANLNENFGDEPVVSSSSYKPRGLKDLSHADICTMLMEKARTEIIRELNK